MKWVALCIRNKLIVFIGVIALCLFGLFCLYNSQISPFPSMQGDNIFIGLSYPGANAQAVQKQVTAEVVARLRAIHNLEYIHANSQAGEADIMLALNSTSPTDLLQTQMRIMQAISAAHLPSSVPQPIIDVTSGMSGLIEFMVSSKSEGLFDIYNFVQSTLLPKFTSLPGVEVAGTTINPVVKVKLNPEALAKYQLNPADVASTLNLNYQSNPLGSLYVDKQQYMLNLSDNYNSLDSIRNLVIGYQQESAADSTPTSLGMPIYLRNVAKVAFEARNVAQMPYSTFNGRSSGSIHLFTSTQANPFVVSQTSRDFVNEIQKNITTDITITPEFDMAKVMSASMEDVSITIVVASFLVLLVALVFLGHLRTTIVPIVTIPVCLLGASILLYLCGFSLNILTLLAMVIAVGLVVDDAIVVVENVTRLLEQGMSKTDAVLHGTADISKTIIGITLTLIAVYIPIMFSAGDISKMLRPFALTLAGAVFISGIVALTLTPVMSSMLVIDHSPNRYQIWFSGVFHKIIGWHQYLLKHVLKIPKTSLLIVAIILVIGGIYAFKLPRMIFPADPSNIVEVNIVGSANDTVDTLKEKTKLFAKFFNSPKVNYYSTSIDKDFLTGILTSKTNIAYKPEFLKQNLELTNQIKDYIKKNNISNAYAKMQNFSNWGDFDVSFYIYGDESAAHLNRYAEKINKILKKSPMFASVANNINYPQKQLAFKIDMVKAASVGILRQQITQVLSTYYGGNTLNNYFSIDGLSVPIVVQLNNNDLTDPQSFEKLQIKSPLNNRYYPLAEFVTLQTVAKPLMVSTFNNLSAVKFDTNLSKGYNIGQAIDYVNQVIKQTAPTLQYQYVDNAKQYLKGNKETVLIALLGIVCIYFLLTILFKNLHDAFIIMLTVPFSVIGGALSLYIIGGSLNIYSVLGLITLVGLITKHGVLIVQFANAELEKGASVMDAILLATHHRFRPIIMTTLAMVFGALPLVFSSNIMYVSRQNLGIVIVGGLLIGTLFSLFIVPIEYVLLKKES